MLLEGRPGLELSARYDRGIDTPSPFPTPPTGSFKLLAVAVDFSDNTGTVATTFFDTLIFSTTPSSSVVNYFDEVSYTSLTLVTVNAPSTLGWKRAPHPYNGASGYVDSDGTGGTTYDYGWGPYPQNLQGIVADVVPLIDPVVDFSQYDNDNDGFVDGITFIYAGPGAEITGLPSDIFSCAWNLSVGSGPGPLLTQDGVSVDNFAFDPEYMVTVSAATSDQTIGVFCHELGHTLFGLPDLYDLDNSSYGLGYWSLMSFGGWNVPAIWNPYILQAIPSGSSPAWPDIWCRTVMGFEQPMPIYGAAIGHPLPPVENGPGLAVQLKSPQLGPKEYFLVENRQQMKFDSFLPGSGLLIWHVDEDKWNQWELNRQECTSSPNCSCPISHYLIALEQADGALHLENYLSAGNPGDAGDPFPGTSVNTNFHSGTTPESGSWYASPCPTNSCIAVKNINTTSWPLIQADLHTVCQTTGACADVEPDTQMGWGQPGTTVTYTVSVQNCGNSSDKYNLVLTNTWSSGIFDLSGGSPISQTGSLHAGQAKPVGITVTVPVTAVYGDIDLATLKATSNNNSSSYATSPLLTSVPHKVLLVDDDRNNSDVEGPYTKALANNNIPYDYWDTVAFGSPSATDLNAHQTVIWFTGSPTYDSLCPRDEIALADYLDQGGQLFLCSREYLKDVGRSSFNREYLHVGTYQEDILTTSIMGVPGNPVGNRLGTHPLSPHASFADLIHPYAPASGATTDAGGIFNGLTVDSSTWQAAMRS